MNGIQTSMKMENAYHALADELIEFVESDKFDRAISTTKIFHKATQTSYARFYESSVAENDRFPSLSVAGPASRAALFLRDHLLRTTGQRIWGLTFTLYPDGKFKLDYDYDKPANYEETPEETLALYQAVDRLDALGVDVGVTAPPASGPELDLLRRARLWLEARTEQNRAWGLCEETRWNLEMHSGELRFEFADGNVRSVPVQIVGTYDTRDGSFMWGWDHPSVPEALRRAARRVHDYGTEHGIERFTTRTVACTEDDAWDFTAAAAMLDGAAGAYRGDAGGTWVYMSFGEAV